MTYCEHCGKLEKAVNTADFRILTKELNTTRKKIMSLAKEVEGESPETKKVARVIREAASMVDSAEKTLWSASSGYK